MIQLIAGVN